MTGSALLLACALVVAFIVGAVSIGHPWLEAMARIAESVAAVVFGAASTALLLVGWRQVGWRVAPAVAVAGVVGVMSWRPVVALGEAATLRRWLANNEPGFERVRSDDPRQAGDDRIESDLDDTQYRLFPRWFVGPPKRGIVFDPNGVLQSFTNPRRRGWRRAPARIAGRFGGGLVRCRPIRDQYFYCRQEP